MLRLKEIHFNHNTDSATGDALNIRLNHLPGTIIQAPEWRVGNESLPVAYARKQVGKRVTIKATLHGSPNSTSTVRTRDASGFTRRNAGPVKWLALLIVWLLGLDYGAVLGEVADSVISFGSNGDSGPIEVEVRGHRIKRASVGIYRVSWIWEYLDDGNWQPFAETEHKIYILLDEPQEPWSNGAPGSGKDEPSLAWVDALELACVWAAGATSQVEAARLITKRINSHSLLSYDYPSFFVDCCYSYLLSCFISLLRLGAAFCVNCDDCACAVATFSNLLGCQLRVGDINPKEDTLDTLRVLLIGRDPSSAWHGVTGWGHHEVAWWPEIGEKQSVYDACLQLDLSKGVAPVPRPHLATKMKFFEERYRGYRNYLLRTDYELMPNGFVRKIR